jgi:hypothetical protein
MGKADANDEAHGGEHDIEEQGLGREK